MTATYLFSWNPARWAWTHLDESLERVAKHGFVDERWSCGVRRRLAVGSSAVLIRLGPRKPTGIVGLGVTRSEPFEAPHYSIAGKRAWYVDVRWHQLRREPPIGWRELQRSPFAGFRWGIEGSGVELPEEQAAAIRARWEARSSRPLLADELPSQGRYVEGSRVTITVNAYERDPGARADCLEHYGYVCAVCDVRLEDRYGEIAREFIHVHHLVPIAKIGKSYEVDPIRDLRPVCPNCHAILHRREPPLSIGEARRLVRR